MTNCGRCGRPREDSREFCPDCDAHVERTTAPGDSAGTSVLTVAVDPEQLHVRSGATAEAKVTVRNASTRDENVRLQVTVGNVRVPWLTVDPAEVAVPSGAEVTALLQASPKPSVGQCAGTWPFQLTATSDLDDHLRGITGGSVRVHPTTGTHVRAGNAPDVAQH